MALVRLHPGKSLKSLADRVPDMADQVQDQVHSMVDKAKSSSIAGRVPDLVDHAHSLVDQAHSLADKVPGLVERVPALAEHAASELSDHVSAFAERVPEIAESVIRPVSEHMVKPVTEHVVKPGGVRIASMASQLHEASERASARSRSGRRRRSLRGRSARALFVAGLGATAAYMLDPEQGASRREAFWAKARPLLARLRPVAADLLATTTAAAGGESSSTDGDAHRTDWGPGHPQAAAGESVSVSVSPPEVRPPDPGDESSTANRAGNGKASADHGQLVDAPKPKS